MKTSIYVGRRGITTPNILRTKNNTYIVLSIQDGTIHANEFKEYSDACAFVNDTFREQCLKEGLSGNDLPSHILINLNEC